MCSLGKAKFALCKGPRIFVPGQDEISSSPGSMIHLCGGNVFKEFILINNGWYKNTFLLSHLQAPPWLAKEQQSSISFACPDLLLSSFQITVLCSSGTQGNCWVAHLLELNVLTTETVSLISLGH